MFTDIRANPEQMRHVGNRLDDDFNGAQAAGLKAVIYGDNRHEGQRYQSIPQVHSLLKLTALLNYTQRH
jgi:FMN phosphatase YigB (HAD superfamily)